MLKENRSLDRGLMVLETLAQHPAMSLADLHRATELPKSTLRRILATLAARRFIRRSLSDGLYRAMIHIPDLSLAPVPAGLAKVADIALPHVLELTRAIGWPSDIHVFEGNCMRIIESTRALSPYGLYQVQVDQRVSLFNSATGLACLSQMPEPQVQALFADDQIAPSFRPDHIGLSWEALQQLLATIRRNGYGCRLTGAAVSSDTDPTLAAIALPLRRNGEVWGGVSLLWPHNFMRTSDFADRYLGHLENTVARIEDALATAS